jgi:hypothetical protein
LTLFIGQFLSLWRNYYFVQNQKWWIPQILFPKVKIEKIKSVSAIWGLKGGPFIPYLQAFAIKITCCNLPGLRKGPIAMIFATFAWRAPHGPRFM